MNVLKWLEDWYSKKCNGDWEHTFGLQINTIDNPGWSISIDIKETSLEGLQIPYACFENSEDDWYCYKVENDKYDAFGDASKLEFLLLNFRKIVESKR